MPLTLDEADRYAPRTPTVRRLRYEKHLQNDFLALVDGANADGAAIAIPTSCGTRRATQVGCRNVLFAEDGSVFDVVDDATLEARWRPLEQ